MRWPRSKFAQGLLAFTGAAMAAVATFTPILYATATMLERAYPHDGQNSLGAFVYACVIALFVLNGGFVALFALQRRLFNKRRQEVSD